MKDLSAAIKIFQQLDTETTVLTPNRRLAATLHKFYQQYQIEQRKEYWVTPDFLPFSSWMQRLWTNYASKTFNSPPLLLNTLQEQFLWEKILLSHSNTPLLQESETAAIAKSAFTLLKQWQIDIHHPMFNSTEDYAALRDWVNQFQKLCQENNWVEMATLPDLLCEKIKTQEIVLPQQIILIGFTEFSPQFHSLLKKCQEFHCKVSELSLAEHAENNHRMSFPDEEDEIITMARWAKSLYKSNSTANIGCVIPSLDKKRDRVMQVFSSVFAEENAYTVDPQKNPVNISAGKSMVQYPIIHTALQLLGLHKNTITTELLSSILASPFLGEAEIEKIKRAHFDILLRRENINTLNLQKETQEISDKPSAFIKYCPLLAKRIRRFLAVITENPKTLSYGDWAELFNKLLLTLGWPGERSLNSQEYQIVENGLKLFAEFSSLNQVSKEVNFQQALQTLHKIAAKTIFQPKTPEAPIQVLGMLEAAALPFDFLWVAGLDDLSWPPQPKPNPFIPKSLQRELNMPHATAQRELMFCERITEQFKQSAKQVIFSHAEKNEELELQPSPLIRDLPEIKPEQLNLEVYLAPSERIYHAKLIETVLDEIAPSYRPEEKIRGGVSVIKQQALCPFRAFAEWRLHAQALESPSPGLRAKDRGTIIHKIMEILWNKLQNHATLVAQEEEMLTDLIHTSIDEALNTSSHSRSELTQYLALEKKRLYKLIWEWLQIEKKRRPFKVITSEKATQLALNQLNLSIRIDRIDELSDGKKLIIDYKTGKNNEISNWFSDRPDEPQLPLYSLLDPENTIGITFAQIATGEHCFKGVSRDALEIKGIKLVSEIKKTTALSWEEQLIQWDTLLKKLSDDFYSGVAKVDPKEPPQTCEWCALKPFCRINEEEFS